MKLDPRHLTWTGLDRFIPRTFVQPFARFARTEASSGLVLLIATVPAFAWANSAWSHSYFQFFEATRFTLMLGPVGIDEAIGHLMNDGLLAIFFFVVGLEIKRELDVGELRNPKAAALPVFAAVGGMVFPALILAQGGQPSEGSGTPQGRPIPRRVTRVGSSEPTSHLERDGFGAS